MRHLNKRYWPYKIKLDFDEPRVDSAIAWCREHLGQYGFKIIGASTFYFTNKEDAAMFKLSWA